MAIPPNSFPAPSQPFPNRPMPPASGPFPPAGGPVSPFGPTSQAPGSTGIPPVGTNAPIIGNLGIPTFPVPPIPQAAPPQPPSSPFGPGPAGLPGGGNPPSDLGIPAGLPPELEAALQAAAAGQDPLASMAASPSDLNNDPNTLMLDPDNTQEKSGMGTLSKLGLGVAALALVIGSVVAIVKNRSSAPTQAIKKDGQVFLLNAQNRLKEGEGIEITEQSRTFISNLKQNIRDGKTADIVAAADSFGNKSHIEATAKRLEIIRVAKAEADAQVSKLEGYAKDSTTKPAIGFDDLDEQRSIAETQARIIGQAQEQLGVHLEAQFTRGLVGTLKRDTDAWEGVVKDTIVNNNSISALLRELGIDHTKGRTAMGHAQTAAAVKSLTTHDSAEVRAAADEIIAQAEKVLSNPKYDLAGIKGRGFDSQAVEAVKTARQALQAASSGDKEALATTLKEKIQALFDNGAEKLSITHSAE